MTSQELKEKIELLESDIKLLESFKPIADIKFILDYNKQKLKELKTEGNQQ